MEIKDSIKILGINITEDLNWDLYTNTLIGNLKHCYRSFHRSGKFLTTDSKKMLYNAAIASRTNYCDVVWDNCSQRSQSTSPISSQNALSCTKKL